MEQNGIIRNKLYLSLLCTWLGLYLVQMVLSFANVRGNVFVYILAVLNALVVAAVAVIGYVKKERLFLLLPFAYAVIQIALFLFSIPAMVTGKDVLPRFLQCLLFVPGYGLTAGAHGWRWAFAAYWGIVLMGAGEGLGIKMRESISHWWEKDGEPWLKGKRRPKKKS